MLGRSSLRAIAAAAIVWPLSFNVPAIAAAAAGETADGTVARLQLRHLVSPMKGLFGCGASDARPLRAASSEEGDWLSFDFAPATLSPRFKGTLHARNFTVVGDFENIEIQVGPGAPARRFERRERLVRSGIVLSVFDLAFPYEDYRDLLALLPIRFDCIDPGCEGETSFPYRVRPSTMPRARVVRINDRVQYSSHVVNIVAPDEIELPTLPAGDRFFRLSGVAEVFFTHFEDSYEELALVPSRVHASPASGAGFDRIFSAVDGIAVEPEDRRTAWGGSEVLLLVSTYLRGDSLWNYLALHEIAHQWGFLFDLFAVAGVAPQRSDACRGVTSFGQLHQPLLADQPSFLSHCLFPPLRITRRAGGWVLADAPTPILFHPLQAYAMGLLAPEDVPPLFLRRRQDRPQEPRPGIRMKGQYVEVTLDDIIAHYGERSGPVVPPRWRRATIVVSPERLLSPRDLGWYNFFARRIADPDVTGIEGLDRVPSLEVASAGAIDLRTEIRPLAGSQVHDDFEVSRPQLGKRDIPGVKLDRKLATHYQVGRRHVIAGRVFSPGADDTIAVQVGGRVFTGEIGPGGRFAVELRFAGPDRGPHWLTLALVDSGKVLGRVAPVYVE